MKVNPEKRFGCMQLLNILFSFFYKHKIFMHIPRAAKSGLIICTTSRSVFTPVFKWRLIDKEVANTKIECMNGPEIEFTPSCFMITTNMLAYANNLDLCS